MDIKKGTWWRIDTGERHVVGLVDEITPTSVTLSNCRE